MPALTSAITLTSANLVAVMLQPAPVTDFARALAERNDSAGLIEVASRHPDEARTALGDLLARVVSASGSDDAAERLRAAILLGEVYATVTGDSFPLLQARTFASWPQPRRAAKVRTDSLRRAGVDASRRHGIAAGVRLWRQSLSVARASHDTAGQAAALGNIGVAFYISGNGDSATVYLTRARDLGAAAGDIRTRANAIGALASLSKDNGQLAAARQLYADALALRSRIGDEAGTAADHNNLGLILQSLGDNTGARTMFESALSSHRRSGRQRNAATALTNLANLASLEAEYGRADSLYAEARDIYNRLGDRADAAFVTRNIGLMAMRRGDHAAAARELADALKEYETVGPPREAIATRRELALAASARGDLRRARRELGLAQQRASAAGLDAPILAELALANGDINAQLNVLAEADRAYARAERLFRSVNDHYGEARALEGRATLLLARQEYAAALRLLQRAESSLRGGDRVAWAGVMILIGYAQRQVDDTSRARQSLSRALATLSAADATSGEALALAALGDLELQLGATAAAESLYRRGVERLDPRPAPHVKWQLYSGLGEARRVRGDLAGATRAFQAAVDEVEGMVRSMPVEEHRAAFLDDKWSTYADLALTLHARGLNVEAFQVSERMRARQMLDLLARGRVATAPADSVRRAREQDLRRRIGELTLMLGSTAGGSLRGPSRSGVGEAAREALDAAQRAYADLLLELRERSPEYERIVSGRVVSVRDVTSRLSHSEAMIEYMVTDSTTLAFVVTSRGVTCIDLRIGRQALRSMIELARAGMSPPDSLPSSKLWRAPLRRLHRQLIEPLEAAGLLAGISAIIVVPHAELHYLPFAALSSAESSGERFLVERYDISYAPSASLWVRSDKPRAAGAGVLALAPNVRALPASRDEVEAIRRIYGRDVSVLAGDAATESSIVERAPRAAILHLATFGVLNKSNPLFSYVALSASDGYDGRLEVHELFGLSVSARLVVLSACQTALGSGLMSDVPAGDDWVGLVRGFLFAGAQNVVATLWPVEDRATARFMERFYGELRAGRSESRAVSQAQRASLGERATSHPFFWAGFTLVSRRGSCDNGECQQ